MADYPTKDEKTGIYHLAFVMPPSERGTTSDTVFDLAYWRWGLDKAQEWRQRMGLARVPLWDWVRRNSGAAAGWADGLFIHTADNGHKHPKRQLGSIPIRLESLACCRLWTLGPR